MEPALTLGVLEIIVTMIICAFVLAMIVTIVAGFLIMSKPQSPKKFGTKSEQNN